MKRTITWFLALCMTLMLAACGEHQALQGQTASQEAERTAGTIAASVPQDEKAEDPRTAQMIEALREAIGRVDRDKLARMLRTEQALRDRVAGMTDAEKVGQLFFVRCPARDAASKIAAYHLGGVLLFTQDYRDAGGAWLTREALTDKIAAFQSAAADDTGIPLFIGSDEEGGTVTRASRNPNLFPAKFPSPQKLWKSGGMEGLLTETQQYNAALRALGINVNFAPVCDVSVDPGDFIYDRSFGQSAEATADYIAQVVPAMNDAEIGCVLKHFPGYGNNVDTHTGIAIDRRAHETFETQDFLPFAAGIAAGAPFVLVSHNVVTSMDAELPASLSPAVHEELRALGFTGVALTDDLAMDAVAAYAKNGSAAVLAVLAGNDMIVTTDFEHQIPQVLAAVENGTIPAETLDAACLRVLRVKLQLGLLEV